MIFNCLILVTLLFTSASFSSDYLPWEEIQQRFSKVSKNTKALSHVKCFFESHEKDHFQLKSPSMREFYNRCYAKPIINLDSNRVFALIDYTVPSDQERMFLIDRKTGEIFKMAVAHGRYHTGFFNRKMGKNKNTVREIKYYSNEIGSMASSSGFFIAGQVVEARDFGRSLVIHGLEEGINDNACERNVVIHQHFLMSKSKAYVLSSGCPMVSPSYIEQVISLLRGTSDDDLRLKTSGSLVFIYGPREAQWQASSCPGNFQIE